MNNIILLGVKGYIGSSVFDYLSNADKIFTDIDHKLTDLLTLGFLKSQNISCIINCIGSTKDSSLFLHSNLYVPTAISNLLFEYDRLNLNRILFIQFSSIGVNAPYSTFNLNPLELNLDERAKIYFNSYELSKCACEYILKARLSELKNIRTVIIQPSIVVADGSKFIRKLSIFLFLLPFKLPNDIEPPFTTLNLINSKVKHLLLNYKNSEIYKFHHYRNILTMPLIERLSIYKLLPKVDKISLFKPVLSRKKILSIVDFLPNIFPFLSIKRVIFFLVIL